MLPLYNSEKHIINIDESWLSVSDFRHHSWQAKTDQKSMNNRALKLKINMIVAVSNRGKAWLALTYVNTNEQVMQLFISNLADILSKEMGPHWRKQTVILLDGASYHRSKITRRFM